MTIVKVISYIKTQAFKDSNRIVIHAFVIVTHTRFIYFPNNMVMSSFYLGICAVHIQKHGFCWLSCILVTHFNLITKAKGTLEYSIVSFWLNLFQLNSSLSKRFSRLSSMYVWNLNYYCIHPYIIIESPWLTLVLIILSDYSVYSALTKTSKYLGFDKIAQTTYQGQISMV